MAATEAIESKKRRKRKSRWGDAESEKKEDAPKAGLSSDGASPSKAVIDGKAKALALQASVRARLEALKAKQKPGTKPATSKIASQISSAAKRSLDEVKEEEKAQPKAKRAKHFELDMSVTGPTFEPTVKKPAVKINPYLAHHETKKDEGGDTGEDEELMDERLVRSSKPRYRHKAMQFIEPGMFTEIAERKRQKAANAEQSGFVSGRKAGNFVHSSTMSSIYGGDGLDNVADDGVSTLPPRAEGSEKSTIPYVLEWWDVELLPSKLKKQVAAYEGKVLNAQSQSQMKQLQSSKKGVHIPSLVSEEADALRKTCFDQASLSYSKTAALIQHIVPIRPAHAKADEPEKQPTLYLTDRERKRQRKLRREQRQRELQDMQVAGLVPPPEPRLTLKNFIRVLGDQAYVDPSQMEAKVNAQVMARQRAHEARNAATKLTKEQRSEKRAKKLQEDTSDGVHVALFYVKDMSHPYHRTKVDLNVQQLNVTGGVLECGRPQLTCVICEGGPKAMKKLKRLMTVRMKWGGPDNADEDDEDDEMDIGNDNPDGEKPKPRKFNQDNLCELVWEGMAAKRFFKGFVFQSCESSDEAGKILKSKGVGHFWDQILMHASGRDNKMQLKLLGDDSSDDEN